MNATLADALNYAGKQLLFKELDLAVTFCKSALSVCESSNTASNAEHAECAVQAALLARAQLQLSIGDEELLPASANPVN